MLLIEAKKRKPVTWHLGSDSAFPNVPTASVTLVQADGEELEIILKQCHNFPHTSTPTQVWVGEFARQLFVNLHYILAHHQATDDGPAVGFMAD